LLPPSTIESPFYYWGIMLLTGCLGARWEGQQTNGPRRPVTGPTPEPVAKPGPYERCRIGVSDLDAGRGAVPDGMGCGEGRGAGPATNRTEVVLESADARGSKDHTDGLHRWSPQTFSRTPAKLLVFYAKDPAPSPADFYQRGGRHSPSRRQHSPPFGNVDGSVWP